MMLRDPAHSCSAQWGCGLIGLEAMELLEKWQKDILRLVSLTKDNEIHQSGAEKYPSVNARTNPCQGWMNAQPTSEALEEERQFHSGTTPGICFPR